MRWARRQLSLALLVLLGLAAAPARGAPFLVPLGGAQLVLEAPAGFSDTGFLGSPRIDELAQALTSASNRILLFAITDGDLRAFMNGDRPELRRYMLAAIPRSFARRSVSLDEFAALTGEALRGLGKPAGGAADYRKYLEARPTGQASLLAELKIAPEVVSVLQGTRLPPGGESGQGHYVLSTTSWLLLRGRALSVSVYTGYDGPTDLEWIKYVTQRWIDQLQRINRR